MSHVPQDSTDDAPTVADTVLATDLDGTLIPLDGDPHQQADLEELTANLRRSAIPLVFVTGRHLESVYEAMAAHSLPLPDWIICDVGTTVCHRDEGGRFQPVPAYAEAMHAVVTRGSDNGTAAGSAVSDRERMVDLLEGFTDLRMQESVKQGPFKISYYTDANHVQSLTERLADLFTDRGFGWSVLPSVDPFTGDGLIDVLPTGVSKAYALDWWSHYSRHARESIVFAGDSGNDLAALTAGYRAIVVGNADRQIAERVRAAHEASGWNGRLVLAEHPATSGVLEGCRAFGLW